MNSRSDKILIMGFGSSILTDDGVALKIVDQLKKDLDSGLFCFETDSLISLEAIEVLAGYKKIFLIDAVTKEKEIIGGLKYFDLKEFKSSVHLYNIHDLSIHQLKELANYLAFDITNDIKIITINIKEKEFFSSKLSLDLDGLFKQIYKKIAVFIKNDCIEEKCSWSVC